jgi:hypothetical protein
MDFGPELRYFSDHTGPMAPEALIPSPDQQGRVDGALSTFCGSSTVTEGPPPWLIPCPLAYILLYFPGRFNMHCAVALLLYARQSPSCEHGDSAPGIKEGLLGLCGVLRPPATPATRSPLRCALSNWSSWWTYPISTFRICIQR